MKAFVIARKTLRELLRERMTTGLMLIFPVLLVGFYYIAFGQTEQGLAKYLSVLVLNRDTGVVTPEGERWNIGRELIDLMREVEYEGDPIFSVTEVEDRQGAEVTLREHKASLLMEIPSDFTDSFIKGLQTEGIASSAELILIGAPESGDYTFARSILSGLLRQFTFSAAGWDESVDLQYRFVPGTGTMSDFDFGVGGIIIFGITFGVLVTAEVMVREDLIGTLQRIRLSRASATDLLLGVSLAMMIIAVIQVPITLGSALAMGFHNNGSLLLVIVIGLLMSLASIGVGLIVACYSRTPGDATNLASVALVPLVFLSEAMYPMPDLPIATISNRTIQVYDLLPTTHAAEAIRRVTIFGEGLMDIAYELVALVLLSAIFLAIGVALYHRRRLRRR
jgi:ABC-type multidrug transport system permease subunit